MNPESSGREGVEEGAMLELSADEKGLWSGNEVPYGLAYDLLVSAAGCVFLLERHSRYVEEGFRDRTERGRREA